MYEKEVAYRGIQLVTLVSVQLSEKKEQALNAPCPSRGTKDHYVGADQKSH